MCTEAVVSQAVKNLLALLQETGIADEDGVIRDPEWFFQLTRKDCPREATVYLAGWLLATRPGERLR